MRFEKFKSWFWYKNDLLLSLSLWMNINIIIFLLAYCGWQYVKINQNTRGKTQTHLNSMLLFHSHPLPKEQSIMLHVCSVSRASLVWTGPEDDYRLRNTFTKCFCCWGSFSQVQGESSLHGDSQNAFMLRAILFKHM